MTLPPSRESGLAAQGWTRRSLLAEPRLSEVVEEYRELGFEVLALPVQPGAEGESGTCTACWADPRAAAQIKIVFTRPGGVKR